MLSRTYWVRTVTGDESLIVVCEEKATETCRSESVQMNSRIVGNTLTLGPFPNAGCVTCTLQSGGSLEGRY